MSDARKPVVSFGRTSSPVIVGGPDPGGGHGRQAWVKVPEIGVWFWVAKVLTTGMGETASDFLVHAIDPVVALAGSGLALAVILGFQFASRRYVPWIYWTAVTMVSVFGTMAADAVHVVLKVPYLVSVAFFLSALAAAFLLWYRTEKTLSIHSIDTRRREAFYWTAVLVAFALGTAAGDLTAYTFSLGYFTSGVSFAAGIALAGLVFWRGWLAEVPAFWFAYVLTRPLGASFADWTAVGSERGGLGLGTGPVTLALAGAITLVIIHLTRRNTGTAVTAG